MKRDRENDINEIEEEEEEIEQVEEVEEDEEMSDADAEEEAEDVEEEVQDPEEGEGEGEGKVDRRSMAQKLADRFIHTMAQAFIKSYSQGRLSRDRLRNYYFEAIQQVNHQEIKELLFKVKAWNTFFYLIRQSLEFKDDNEDGEAAASDEMQVKQSKQATADIKQQQKQEREREREKSFEKVKSIDNIIRLNCIGAEESIEQILSDNQTKNNKINSLYEQILLSDQHTPLTTSIFSHYFKSKSTSTNSVDLLTTINNLTISSNNIYNTNYLSNVTELISSVDYKNIKLVEQCYEQLKKYISITVLPNINKCDDKYFEDQFVELATELLKLSLVLSASNAKRSYQVDYTIINMMLGKSRFLGKIVSVLTSFDFGVAPFLVNQKDGIVAKLITKFMETSDLSPPTSSTSYLKSRILLEKAIQLFTITKDSMLLKLKIASASLLPPIVLVEYINRHKDLLFSKTASSLSNNDIVKAIRSSKLDTILKIQEHIENDEEVSESESEESSQDEQDMEDLGITINKSGNKEAEDSDDEEDDKDKKPSAESSKLLESLLDGLSDDEDEEDD